MLPDRSRIGPASSFLISGLLRRPSPTRQSRARSGWRPGHAWRPRPSPRPVTSFLSHPAELFCPRGCNRQQRHRSSYGCSPEPLRQPSLSQGPEVHRLGEQGGLGLDAAGRDAGAGEAPRQSDQWLQFLHRHAHQGRRAGRGDLDAPQPGRGLAGGQGVHRCRARCSGADGAGHPHRDAAGGVTDEAWANAAKHYDEDQLAALVAVIALTNAFNRGKSSSSSPPATTSPASSDNRRGGS
jgi:hypothetical protein